MTDGMFFRCVPLDRQRVDATARRASVAFSSETPVNRFFGPEYLLHGAGNVRLEYLRDIGAALLNHKPDKIVGRLENIAVIDRRGHCDIVFDDDEIGAAVMKKVRSGSLRGVSVGYMVNIFQEVDSGQQWIDHDSGRVFAGPCYVATDWTPYEISLTPTPADATVGVGRETLDGITIRQIATTSPKERILTMQPIDASKAKVVYSHAKAIGQDVAAEVANLWLDGKPEAELWRFVANKAVMLGVPLPLATSPTTQPHAARVADVSDEDFVRAICNPATFGPSMDLLAAQTTGQAGKRVADLSDAEFARMLSNPAPFSLGN